MSTRGRILNRLHAAKAPPLARPEIGAVDIAEEERLGRLTVQLQAAHAEVIDARDTDWQQAVVDVCAAQTIHRLMLAPNVPAFDAGKSAVVARLGELSAAAKDELFLNTDAALTIADCALAATGMLVLAASPTQPRSLSLVPPIHICLIDATRIHADLNAALVAEGWNAAMPSNLIFISGPSKTADIQQTLAYGAHGPKQLIVIVAAPGSLT